MRVYDGEKLRFTATTPRLNAVTESKFSADGKWLLNIADGRGYVQLWDVTKGERVKTFLAAAHQYRLNFADFTPDSRRVLLSFPGDGTSQVRDEGSYFRSRLLESSLWELPSLRRAAVMSVPARESAYNGRVHFSADGRRMAFTDDGGPASVWNA